MSEQVDLRVLEKIIEFGGFAFRDTKSEIDALRRILSRLRAADSGDFAEDRRICEAATAGPWEENDAHPDWVCPPPFHAAPLVIIAPRKQDKAFAIAARTRWPAALDRIQALESELAELKAREAWRPAKKWTIALHAIPTRGAFSLFALDVDGDSMFGLVRICQNGELQKLGWRIDFGKRSIMRGDMPGFLTDEDYHYFNGEVLNAYDRFSAAPAPARVEREGNR